MVELFAAPGGEACVVNQVLYHLEERGIEWDMMDQARLNETVTMAYSPLAQGELMDDETLRDMAADHGVTPAAVALAWVMKTIPDCRDTQGGEPRSFAGGMRRRLTPILARRTCGSSTRLFRRQQDHRRWQFSRRPEPDHRGSCRRKQ